jgi:hypothetical protein
MSARFAAGVAVCHHPATAPRSDTDATFTERSQPAVIIRVNPAGRKQGVIISLNSMAAA